LVYKANVTVIYMKDGQDLDVEREVIVIIPLLGLGLHINTLVLIGLLLCLVLDLLRRLAGGLGLRNGVGDETAKGGVTLVVIILDRGTLLALALSLVRGWGLGGLGSASGVGASGLAGGGRWGTVVVAVAFGMAQAELLEDLLGPLLGCASSEGQLDGEGTRWR
jgi:hypothetical protein